MTKGRKHHPLLSHEGDWFHHMPGWRDVEAQKSGITSTRAMLETLSAPPNYRNPPNGYSQREQPSYKTSNPFSNHDNRHTIEGQAEYLGNGFSSRCFGRRLHPIDRRLHHTDATFFYQGSPNSANDYSPTTAMTFTDPGQIEPLAHRRFPKIYRNVESSDTNTGASASSSSSYRTPLRVLAMSQQPFQGRNTWNYSYKGRCRVYPPYDTK